MRQIVKTYRFSAPAKTVTLPDFTTLDQARVLLIVDTTINAILYNVVDPTISTATVAGNVITLSALTGGAASTDKLMVAYDGATGDPSYDQTPVINDSETLTLTRLLNALARPEHLDPVQNALRVALGTPGQANTAAVIGGVTTVTTVSSVTNVAGLGSLSSDPKLTLLYATERELWATAIRARVT